MRCRQDLTDLPLVNSRLPSDRFSSIMVGCTPRRQERDAGVCCALYSVGTVPTKYKLLVAGLAGCAARAGIISERDNLCLAP
jgi:hypothetical protein